MSGWLSLLRRELSDRRALLVAALVAGLLPYALAPLATPDGGDAAETRLLLARAVLLIFLVMSAIFLGRWLTAELAGRRAFELARPLSSWRTSSSKLAAIACLLLGCPLVTSLPTGFAVWRVDRRAFTTFLIDQQAESAWRLLAQMAGLDPAAPPGWPALGSFLALALVAALVLVIATQALTLCLSDLDWSSLADVGAILFLMASLTRAYFRCYGVGAPGLAWSWLAPLGIAIVAIGAVAAGYACGAGVLRQAHRRHALLFDFGLVALGLLAGDGIRYQTTADPKRLESWQVAQPNADFSRWVVAGSQNRFGFEPAFLVDVERGETRYLHNAESSRSPELAWPSADGRQVYFRDDAGQIRLHQVDGGNTRIRFLPYLSGDPRGRVVYDLSNLDKITILPDAARVSHLGPDVHWQDGRQIEAPGIGWALILVVPELGGRFDVLAEGRDGSRNSLRRWTFEPATGSSTARPPLLLPGPAPTLTGEDSGYWRQVLRLVDQGIPVTDLWRYRTRPGEPLRLLALPGGSSVRASPIAARGVPSAGLEWTVHDATGAQVGAFETPNGWQAAGEIRPGLLLVGPPAPEPEDHAAWREKLRIGHPQEIQTWVIDPASGRILRRLEGYLPLTGPGARGRYWLVDRDLVPYDLDSAVAEPRRILPFRPRGAGEGKP